MQTKTLWGLLPLQIVSFILLVGLAQPSHSTPNPGATQPSPPSQRASAKRFVKLRQDDPALRWPPPDVDSATPAVAPGVPCPIDEVLRAASQHVKELTTNLERFSAIERVEDVMFSKTGKAGPASGRSFNYLVLISEPPRGRVGVEERRDGSRESSPNNVAETGLVTSALVFHPKNINDFQMVCEGLGEWGGQPAWQVHFAQRSDMPPRFSAFREGPLAFDVKLKGRAWIARDSYQVKHLEQDLLEPIPQAHLLAEHVATEYRPVEFASRKMQLWLPERVDLYLDYHGHHYYQRHQLSNFLLFSVETGQQIEAPRPR